MFQNYNPIITNIDTEVIGILWEATRLRHTLPVQTQRQAQGLYDVYQQYVKEKDNPNYKNILRQGANDVGILLTSPMPYKREIHKRMIRVGAYGTSHKNSYGVPHRKKKNQARERISLLERREEKKEEKNSHMQEILKRFINLEEQVGEFSFNLAQQMEHNQSREQKEDKDFSQIKGITKKGFNEIKDAVSEASLSGSPSIWNIPFRKLPKYLANKLIATVKKSIFTLGAAPFYVAYKSLDLVVLRPIKDASRFWYKKGSVIWGTILIVVIGANVVNVYYYYQDHPEEWNELSEKYYLEYPVALLRPFYDYTVGVTKQVFTRAFQPVFDQLRSEASNVLNARFEEFKTDLTERVTNATLNAVTHTPGVVYNASTSALSNAVNGIISLFKTSADVGINMAGAE